MKKGKITIGKWSSGDSKKDHILITIFDYEGCKVADARLDFTEFTDAITGRGEVPCYIEKYQKIK